MKRYSTYIIIGLLCVSSLLAGWSGFYGQVKNSGGQPAGGAYVRIWNDSDFDSTVQCDGSGNYYCACPSGYYDMRAWKGGEYQVKYDVYQHGGVGGTEVNFQLCQDPE